ncbi:putative reverse transcriptase domain-containing protein [Tanacetum coccineum]|uniref:Reverse transcriptase domain-containing protein n=1 Tax=Tanacetum coccineum TaxID=301880 RepID=A0ABQ5EAI5_9ASTR
MKSHPIVTIPLLPDFGGVTASTYDDSGEDNDLLMDEENEIVEPDVDMHLFGITTDVPFNNISVTNLVPYDVLEGEDVDELNVDGFDSDMGYDDETGHHRRKRVNPGIPVKAVRYQLQRDLELQVSIRKAFIAKAKTERKVIVDRNIVVDMNITNPNTTVKIAVDRNIDPSLPTRVFNRMCFGDQGSWEKYWKDCRVLGSIGEIEFRIELTPRATPVEKSPYRLAPLNGGVVRTTQGTPRTTENKTVDQLRIVIRSPRIDDLFDQLQGSQFFSKIDLRGKHVRTFIEVQFLGHVINGNGIHVDPSKIKAVKNWKAPRTLTRVLQKGLDEMIEKRSDGTLYYLDQIWVPLKGGVRTMIMDEAHKSKYSVRPGADKMYYDLRDRPSGLLQQPEIPVWKWEGIAMDFVTKLPRTSSGHDIISVIVDRLTKSAHFLPMREDYKMERLARLYLNKIVARHGVLDPNISGCDSHMEDILKCASWTSKELDVHLPLVEFLYNNSYHSSVRCAPFEALYGRKCRSPIMWAEVGEGQLIGPELFYETTERYRRIKDRTYVVDWKGVGNAFGMYGILAPVPLDEIRVDAKLNFMEEPVEILEREFKKLKRSRIAIVKVRWNSKRGPEFTWEREDQMKLKYPHLFSDVSS